MQYTRQCSYAFAVKDYPYLLRNYTWQLSPTIHPHIRDLDLAAELDAGEALPPGARGGCRRVRLLKQPKRHARMGRGGARAAPRRRQARLRPSTRRQRLQTREQAFLLAMLLNMRDRQSSGMSAMKSRLPNSVIIITLCKCVCVYIYICIYIDGRTLMQGPIKFSS